MKWVSIWNWKPHFSETNVPVGKEYMYILKTPGETEGEVETEIN